VFVSTLVCVDEYSKLHGSFAKYCNNHVFEFFILDKLIVSHNMVQEVIKFNMLKGIFNGVVYSRFEEVPEVCDMQVILGCCLFNLFISLCCRKKKSSLPCQLNLLVSDCFEHRYHLAPNLKQRVKDVEPHHSDGLLIDILCRFFCTNFYYFANNVVKLQDQGIFPLLFGTLAVVLAEHRRA